jgi:hypothetical protein
MSNHVKQRDWKRGGSRWTKVSRYRAKRLKTFKSEKSAKAWAETQGIKNYTLVNLKSPESAEKKIKIVYTDNT